MSTASSILTVSSPIVVTSVLSRLAIAIGITLLTAVAGCGEWFDSGGDEQPVVGCSKDLDTLTDLLVNPHACSASAECPVGSYCDISRGTCDWDCFGDSDCGAGNTCSCDGLCGTTTLPDPPADATCPRDETLLTSVYDPVTGAGTRACTFDDECPYGARCDSASVSCVWDCLSTDHATYGCDSGAGEVCDCTGACVVTGAQSDRSAANLPRLQASPSPLYVPEVPAPPTFDPGWAPRRIDIELTTEDAGVAAAAAETVVRMTAGDEHEVNCDPAGRLDNLGYSTTCAVTAGALALEGHVYRAVHGVWVRPILPRTAGTSSWHLWVSSDAVSSGAQLVRIESTAPGDAVEVTEDGEYEGYIELVGVSAYLSYGAERPMPLRVPVRAWVSTVNGTTYIDVYDESRILTPTGKLRMIDNGFVVLQWLTPMDEGTETPINADGSLPAASGLMSRTFEAARGTQTGMNIIVPYHDFAENDVFSANQHWRYRLSKTGDGTSCTQDTDCASDELCDPTFGACTGGPAWVEIPMPPASTLTYRPIERWNAAIRALMAAVVDDTLETVEEESPWSRTFLDYFLAADVYHGTLGVASPALDTHAQVVGADALADMTLLENTGYALCARDFVSYLNWIRDTATVGDADVQLDYGLARGCLDMYYNLWARPGRRDLVPCIDPTTTGTQGTFAALPSDYQGSCGAVFENYRRQNDPLMPPTSAPDLATFLANECVATSTDVQIRHHADPWDQHAIYLCPFTEALLGPLSPVPLAERLMCYDPAVATGMLLESQRFGATALDVSGDLACADGRVPRGIDLVTHADAVAAGAVPLASSAMLVECLDELSAEYEPLASAFDETTAPDHVQNLFPANECFSPAPFYGALQVLSDGLAAGSVTGDPQIGRLFMRLLQQWVELHGFVAAQGRQEIAMAQVLRNRLDLGIAEADAVAATPSYEALLDQMEHGWNLVLSAPHAVSLFEIPRDVLRDPDYRPSSIADEPHHEQPIGLPVALLETTTLHLELLDGYLRDTQLDAYSGCAGGGSPASRTQALARASRTLGYSMAVEGHAVSTYDRATVVECSGPNMPCATGSTCNVDEYEYVCIVDATGDFERDPVVWTARWDGAVSELQAARRRVVRTMRNLQRCTNPLDVANVEVPLYFGDPIGDSSRFFAASDYLLSGWAIPAVDAARASLSAARAAWIDKRNSGIQDTLTANDAERRLEELRASYGRTLIDACGFTEVDARGAMVVIGDLPRQVRLEECYYNIWEPGCSPSSTLVVDLTPSEAMSSAVDDEELQFELCVWADVRSRIGNFIPVDGGSRGEDEDPEKSGQVSIFETVQDGLAVLDELGSAPERRHTAAVQSDGLTFTWTAADGRTPVRPIALLYDVRAYFTALSPHEVSASESACADAGGGVSEELPDMPDLRPVDAACYRGQLGEAKLIIISAKKTMDIAIADWKGTQARLKNQAEYCIWLEDHNDAVEGVWDAHVDYMNWAERALGAAAAASSSLSAVAQPKAGVTAIAGGIVGGAADYWAAELRIKSLKFQAKLSRLQNKKEIKACFHEISQLRTHINGAALRIEHAAIEAQLQILRFANVVRHAEQRLAEGRAAVARELGREVPSVAHHYWLSEHIDRFETDFAWARRLTFLALRAVEYEFQQSLPYADDVVSANHPDELHNVVQALRQEQLSRTINSRRPEGSVLVLSLRDEILRMAQQVATGPGERDGSPTLRFQQRLWSPKYEVYDDAGDYLGQGIPFTLDDVGALKYRCAERLWRMTATVQGDLLDTAAPAAPMFVIRTNSFSSQWCDGRGEEGTVQNASLQPASTLFHPEDRGGAEAAGLSHLTAMLQPYFNVRRSEFYRENYAEGASDELAGRGLYGDYVLLFPWHGLLENGFPLEQVEDVLLRFDYLSVDNISL